MKNIKKIVCTNKKIFHQFFVLSRHTAGIALFGTEVKALRTNKCSINESFVRIDNEEAYVYGMHISSYNNGNIFNRDPLRVRKLLLRKSEINNLFGNVKLKGFSIIPTQVFFKNNKYVKVEIALCKGKKIYDKRESIKKKDIQRIEGRKFKIKNL